MNLETFRNPVTFARFAWVVLAYNIPVILWGAYVRVSFSGDGCGANWPFCNGQVLPQQMTRPTIIEFTHRMMTSLDSFAVIALCVWAFFAFGKHHVVRRYAVWSLIFVLIEAALGAGLVLLRLVAKDQSAGRALYLSAHLTNTLLLLGALAATAWLAARNRERFDLSAVPGRIWIALAVMVLVSVTGAIAALGDTLFPALSLASGLWQDFAAGSASLLRLRFLHPVIAVSGAFYIFITAARNQSSAAKRVLALIVIQIAAGMVNIGLLAPVWMQLTHLAIGDVLWICGVLWALEAAPRATSVSLKF